MRTFARPNIVVSKCLGFAACRCNGVTIPDAFVQQLEPFVTYLPVCAEAEVGLGVPRDPVRIVLVNDEPRLLQPATGANVTEKMQAFSAAHLSSLTDIDGFILTALFALADFRAVKAAGLMRELVRFHTDNKLLLMAYSESQYRLMGPIVANHAKKPAAEVIAAYETHLWKALAHPARCTAGINVLMHALGYFSDKLTSDEKAYFLDALQKYRDEKVPLSVPVSLLGAWIARFKEPYLARQTFLAPYPESLVAISDSGKGRDLG